MNPHTLLYLDIFYRCLATIWRAHKYLYRCTPEKVPLFRSSLEANCDQEKKRFEKAITHSVVLKELGPLMQGEPPIEPRRLIEQIYAVAQQFFKQHDREIREIFMTQTPVTPDCINLADRPPIVYAASGAPVIFMTKALMKPEDWETDEEQVATLTIKSKGRGNQVVFRVSMSETVDLKAMFGGDNEKQIKDLLGPETARVHQLLTTCVTDRDRPWEEIVTIKCSDIVREIGLHDRKDISNSDKLRLVAERLLALNKIDVMVTWQQGRMNLDVAIGQMWNITLEAQRPPAPFAMTGSGEPTEIVVRLRTGLWAEKFLNKTGKKDKVALQQFRGFPRNVLELQARQNDLALRIGLYVAGLSESENGFQVKTIIASVFSENERRKIFCSPRNQHRLKNQWDAALLDLHDQGWVIEFPGDKYPSELVPVWKQPEGIAPRLRKGYFHKFLNAILLIKPGIQKNPVRGKRPTRRGHSAQLPTGEEIRQARIEKGLSQRELAALSGASQSWIGMVEAGKRSPAEYLSALKRVLSLP